MVTTRTQTGTIAPKHYDLGTLRLNATTAPLSPITTKTKSPTSLRAKRQRAPKPPTTKRRGGPCTAKPHSPTTKRNRKTAASKTTRPCSPLGFDPSSPTVQQQQRLSGLPEHMVDVCDGINFFPGRAWGEREEVGLSAVQRAEREVEIWEEVRRSHAGGGLGEVVPAIEAVLLGAREKVEELRRLEREGQRELGVAGVENPGAMAIEKRLKVLEWALSTSKFEPEGENIRGAIEGYRSGAIKYTDRFTIIYAGKIVDTAPTYGSFVGDRQERLDRYAKAHGPHWLWYEPPLKIHPETRVRMAGSLALPRADSWNNLGPWFVTQGFWKRALWVHRMPFSAGWDAAPQEAKFRRLNDGRVWCQEMGPKQAFRSMLDSGATYPSLHTEDLQKLFIDEENYAAQSVALLNTANGDITRYFELFVCVLDEKQRQLVDENHSAWPYHAKYLGGLCPVTEITDPIIYDAEGLEVSTRLSGLLPFVACYISSTPTRNAMFLGEDRKDVLGSHRMPGHRKWDIAIPQGALSVDPDTQGRYGDPKTTFSHRGGKILDEDDPDIDFASTVTLMKGTDQEVRYRHYPKEELEAHRASLTQAQRDEAAFAKATIGLQLPGQIEVTGIEELLRAFKEGSQDPLVAGSPEKDAEGDADMEYSPPTA